MAIIQKTPTKIIFFETSKLKLEREKEKALIDLSQKVAHDLRTPLSSLSLLLNKVGIDEEKKSLQDMSMQRMRDITQFTSLK